MVVFGLRGSGEDPLAVWNILGGEKWFPPLFNGESDGFGPDSWDVYYGLSTRLKKLKPSLRIKPVGIHYLGLSVPIVGLLNGQPVTVNDFNDSTFDGIDKLIARMYSEIRDCGTNTRFVLIGYSQGALAIHYVLRQLERSDSSMLGRVAGVGLVADPGRTSHGAETLWEKADTPAGWWISGSSGSWSSALLFDSNLQGPLPPSVTGKTVSICHHQDMVCSIAPLANIFPHTSYEADETNRMGEWLADVIAGNRP